MAFWPVAIAVLVALTLISTTTGGWGWLGVCGVDVVVGVVGAPEPYAPWTGSPQLTQPGLFASVGSPQ